MYKRQNEDPIVYGAFADYKGRAYEGRMRELFELREQGDIALSEAHKKLTGKRGFFNQQFCYEDRVCYTLSTHLDSLIPFKQPVYLSTSEVCLSLIHIYLYLSCNFIENSECSGRDNITSVSYTHLTMLYLRCYSSSFTSNIALFTAS